MGKFKMSTVKQFLEKKKIYDEKQDPVWVRIEQEMRDNEEKGIKPYNEKVGAWLRFLRDLKCHYYLEGKREERQLRRGVGPSWYCELSLSQREVLKSLKANMHQDLLEDLPNRTRHALSDLGFTRKVPKAILMDAMVNSFEDPGVFIWNLYQALYKKPPSEPRGRYDMNSIILMSSLVFIDLEECIKNLSKLTGKDPPPPPPPIKKPRRYYQPDIRYGEYLQRMYVPCVTKQLRSGNIKPAPLDYKLRLRSETSYENIRNDLTFLEKRKERNRKAAQVERVCTYKFWEPPSTLRNTDPKMAAYVEKLKMMKLKAKVKFKTPYKNVQYQVAGVSFIGGRPQYILANVALLPTGYIPINAGMASSYGDMVTIIDGYWRFPINVREKCSSGCDCLAKWEDIVMKFISTSKCKCGHLYDYYHDGVSKEKYFYPPSRHGPFWLDQAKVYQLDPMEDFIKDTIHSAVMSAKESPDISVPNLSAAGISEKDLLAAFLADLSDTPLLIPHLPDACLLNNLQEWVRKRVRGKLEPEQNIKFKLQSQRNWLNLGHMDFRARAYRIPFTFEELENINWSHRYMVQDLFKILMQNFVTRNRLNQLEQTRLLWSTTKFDAYPSRAFLDIFFTYMPGRMKDTFLINPYSSQNTPKHGAKTCPLSF